MGSDPKVARIEAALELLRHREIPVGDRERAVQELSANLPALAEENRHLRREMERLADMNTQLLLQRDIVMRVLQGTRSAPADRTSPKREPDDEQAASVSTPSAPAPGNGVAVQDRGTTRPATTRDELVGGYRGGICEGRVEA